MFSVGHRCKPEKQRRSSLGPCVCLWKRTFYTLWRPSSSHKGEKFSGCYVLISTILQVNSFPSTAALDRKNKLWNCYKRLQSKIGRKSCNFIPENYNLPQQKQQLMTKVGLLNLPSIKRRQISSLEPFFAQFLHKS